ncbi:hypothetical protein [Plantactinospora sp. DSM 117369]
MANFSVELVGLRRLSDALDDAAVDCGQIEWHARENGKVAGGVGLLGDLKTELENTYTWAQALPRHVSRLLNESAIGVSRAAKQYGDTDQQQAQRLDGMLDGLGGNAARYFQNAPRPRGGNALFTTRQTAEGRLTRNEPHTQVDYKYKYNAMTDSVSITGNIRGLVHQLFGYDIFEFVLKRASGDWDGLVEAADTMDKCAAAMDILGDNLVWFAHDVPAIWTGNAADRARDHLVVLGRAVSERSAQYQHVARTYRELARQAWEIFDALGVALSTLIDKLIEITVKVAAGTATITTVVGGIIGYGAAAYSAKQATQLAYQTGKLLANLENVVKVGKGALAATAGVAGPGTAPKIALPTSPYSASPRPGDRGFVGPVLPPKPGDPDFVGPVAPAGPGDAHDPRVRPGEPGFVGPVVPPPKPKPGDPDFIGPVAPK